MNWYVFFSLISWCVADVYAQDVQISEYYTSDIRHTNLYKPQYNALLLSDADTIRSSVQYGLSVAHNQQRMHHPHHSTPSYDQLALSAQICQSWSNQRFAQEIERSIEYCTACGYSRDQAEQEVLEQHHLYLFPNFIKSIKTLSGYRHHIRQLFQQQPQSKPSIWSKVITFLTCSNQRHAEFVDTIKKLHQEIIEQETLEEAQRKSRDNRCDSRVDTWQLEHSRQAQRVKQQTVRATFDAQRDGLECESTEWHELLDIYQEEGLGNTTRIERRIQTLHKMNNGQVVYAEQSYTLSSSAVQLLQQTGSNSESYTSNYGNPLQQVIHQECIDGIEHLAKLHQSALVYPYQQGIAQCFDAAREYNQAGLTINAATISGFCWTLLDCGLAIAEGAVDGVVGAVKDIAEHPVQAAICAVAGQYVLAYQLSKVLYDVADIGITALVDTDRAAQKWDNYIAPVTGLIDAIQNRQITLRDAIKGATQFAVQWKTQDKLLKGLGTLCTTTKTKAIEFAKNNPLRTPQEYMATPEGILLKSMHNTPPAGSSLKYERSSKLFVANHEEIAALTEYAQRSMQPSQEILQAIGRDSLNTPESFLKHIFAAELKEKRFLTGEIEKSLSGFHHFMPEHLVKMDIQLINTRTCQKTGLIIADVLCDGHLESGKTFFPSSWSRNEVIKKLGEAAQNPTRPVLISGTRATLYGKTSEGIIIKSVADLRSSYYITAYPDARENGLL